MHRGQGVHVADANQTTQTDVLAREDSRLMAMLAADPVALGKLLHDDLVYRHTTGDTDSKRSLLTSLQSGHVQYSRLEEIGRRVVLHPTAAVVIGRLLGSSVLDGVDVPIDSAFTALWLRGDEWRLAAWASTRYAPTR
jgi:hypothetical protein